MAADTKIFSLLAAVQKATSQLYNNRWKMGTSCKQLQTDSLKIPTVLGHIYADYSCICIKKICIYFLSPFYSPLRHFCESLECMCAFLYKTEMVLLTIISISCILDLATHLPQNTHMTMCAHRILQHDQTHRQELLSGTHTCANIPCTYMYIIISLLLACLLYTQPDTTLHVNLTQSHTQRD